eukprot:Em0007g579a
MSMNNTTCAPVYRHGLLVTGSINAAAVALSLLAVIVVCYTRLYRVTVYRLSLYQVLAAIAVSLLHVIEIAMIDYERDPEQYSDLCEAFGYMILYSEWVKLHFTMWVTLHLFCFAVFHKNLKRFEVLYVVTSLVIPSLMAAVPLLTHSYGLAGSGCWISEYATLCRNETSRDGVIEQFALWFVPSTAILIAATVLMVVMVTIMACRLRHRLGVYEPMTSKNQHSFALKQLLPLAVYPLLFVAFNLPPFANRLYTTLNRHANHGLVLATGVCLAAWSASAGLALITHIMMTRSLYKQMQTSRARDKPALKQTYKYGVQPI